MLVWYVSYGSNLCRARFMCYIGGGQPPRAARRYAGCRDRSAPQASALVWLDRELYFAGQSTVWGGGLAFLRTEPSAARTAGRAWLITAEQFSDVVAQENGGQAGDARFDVGDLVAGAVTPAGGASTAAANRWLVGEGNYPRLLHLGELDGHPMVTFTADVDRDDENAPALAYLAMLAGGLVETGAAADLLSAAAYLAACRGVGEWDTASLARRLAALEDAERCGL